MSRLNYIFTDKCNIILEVKKLCYYQTLLQALQWAHSLQNYSHYNIVWNMALSLIANTSTRYYVGMGE